MGVPATTFVAGTALGMAPGIATLTALAWLLGRTSDEIEMAPQHGAGSRMTVMTTSTSTMSPMKTLCDATPEGFGYEPQAPRRVAYTCVSSAPKSRMSAE